MSECVFVCMREREGERERERETDRQTGSECVCECERFTAGKTYSTGNHCSVNLILFIYTINLAFRPLITIHHFKNSAHKMADSEHNAYHNILCKIS